MPRPRFQTVTSTPPGGFYEYELDGDRVVSRNRLDMLRQVRDLRIRKGYPVIGDGMAYVMEFMCPRLPDGFCTTPSSVRGVRVDEVKRDTALLFPSLLAASDDIERRMEVCVGCPAQTTRGFCVECNGLLDWLYRGFSGRRGRLPADNALGVCLCDGVMAAAGASVSDRPLKPGAIYPECCWRTARSAQEVPNARA